MADDTSSPGTLDETTENAALGEALAAEHAAVWGYGVVGARCPTTHGSRPRTPKRPTATSVTRSAPSSPAGRPTSCDAEGGYALPFPVLSAVDAAALAAVLEDGTAAAWVRVLDQAAERSTRALAVGVLSAAEVRAVAWRVAAGQSPVTRAFPGLPE